MKIDTLDKHKKERLDNQVPNETKYLDEFEFNLYRSDHLKISSRYCVI